MRFGSVGFTADGSLLSRLVRWWTRSRWSHVFVYVGEVNGTPVILEANNGKVDIVRLDKYTTGDHVVEVYQPNEGRPALIQRGVYETMRQIEKPYGFAQALGLIPVIAARRLLGLKIKNLSRRGIICSELALRYLRCADPDGPWADMDADASDPEDVREKLAQSDAFTIKTSTRLI